MKLEGCDKKENNNSNFIYIFAIITTYLVILPLYNMIIKPKLIILVEKFISSATL